MSKEESVMFKKISLFLVLVLVIGALSACAGSMPKLSEEKKVEIEDTWYTQYRWRWHDEGGRCRYYGTYEGYDILFNQMGELFADVIGTQKIAGIEFFSGNPFNFYGYRDGKLYEVHELYEQGKLSAESIASAAEIHNSEEKTLPLSDERKEEISRAWSDPSKGQLFLHASQRTHFSSSTAALKNPSCVSSILIAPWGHVAAHAPQPLQRS